MRFGFFALLGVLLLVLCALGGLAVEAGGVAMLRAELAKPITWSVVRFTLWQAMWSTLCSLALAVPFACALARRRAFFGRILLIRLTSISLIIPSMVAVLGMIAVHGRNGWLNQLFGALGFGRQDYLYGFGGILLAHVFFNLPLATRIFLSGLLTIPQHSWNLARLFGMRPWAIFCRIEWPLLRGLVGGVGGLVFLLCFTSFAIVLTLGGGPQATTLEVAIYQAIRFDFDLAKAVALSLLQIGLCLLLVGVCVSLGGGAFPLRAEDAPGNEHPWLRARLPRVLDGVVIGACALFLLTPLAAVVVQALVPRGWIILGSMDLWRALGWTLGISLPAGLLSCVLAVGVASFIAALQGRRARFGFSFGGWRDKSVGMVGAELIGFLTLVVPPITLGAGLFLFFRRFTDALSLAPVLVIALNALFTLAFGIRIVLPALLAQRNRYDPLCMNLGIRGWAQWRYVLLPALRHPLAYALAIATALSAGDMGVIALFGTEKLHTLPLLMLRLLGSYRLEQAAVVALILCALCLVLFFVIERIGGGVRSESTARIRFKHA